MHGTGTHPSRPLFHVNHGLGHLRRFVVVDPRLLITLEYFPYFFRALPICDNANKMSSSVIEINLSVGSFEQCNKRIIPGFFQATPLSQGTCHNYIVNGHP